jgi:hypothetical protein
MGEINDLSQRTDDKDLAAATFFAGVDFDPINERTNDFNNLGACHLISQLLLQSGDLFSDRGPED